MNKSLNRRFEHMPLGNIRKIYMIETELVVLSQQNSRLIRGLEGHHAASCLDLY